MGLIQITEEIHQSQPVSLQLLVKFVKQLRSDKPLAEQQLQQLILHLELNEAQRISLGDYIRTIFSEVSSEYSLTDMGIFRKNTFASEISSRLKHKILPETYPEGTLAYVISTVFNGNNDDKWLAAISTETLARLFELLQLKVSVREGNFRSNIKEAILTISYRITGNALDAEFLVEVNEKAEENPFIRQNRLLNTWFTTGDDQLLDEVFQSLTDARVKLDSLKQKVKEKGTSLQLTYSGQLIKQQIGRLELLIHLSQETQLRGEALAVYLKQLVTYEKNKHRLREQLNETSYLLAYQVAEHQSKTGEHYIVNNKEEYQSFFKASCGGGVIAAFMTFFKILLHHLSLAPFWQAFAYGVNYATGFVAIQISHAALATKQPAMTASRIAQSLDQNNTDRASVQGLALMIGQVSRSQFVSFAGNLLLVFPVSFLIAISFYFGTGHYLVNREEALHMLKDVHPFLNPTWYYACITGVFLFLSGIISGYYDNKVIHRNIPERIRNHYFLKQLLPKRSLIKLSYYIESNLGSLIGNISLGFMLGMSAFLGFIFGIPFDIRHITIASGNYAMAIFTLYHHITWLYALTCLLGVFGVGFFNFMVSFGLATFIAARSRKISRKQFRELLKWTLVYLRRYPRDFFFTPKRQRTVEDLTDKFYRK